MCFKFLVELLSSVMMVPGLYSMLDTLLSPSHGQHQLGPDTPQPSQSYCFFLVFINSYFHSNAFTATYLLYYQSSLLFSSYFCLSISIKLLFFLTSEVSFLSKSILTCHSFSTSVLYFYATPQPYVVFVETALFLSPLPFSALRQDSTFYREKRKALTGVR
jgi:hypothetical protein